MQEKKRRFFIHEKIIGSEFYQTKGIFARPRFPVRRGSARRKSFKALINPDFLYSVLFGKQMLLP
ncbi:MAG: hypothetical protein LBF78_01240 [Treponema sp.]|jgi:hypothetical protein|nr:hypothetical protein [Treponema sp.]